MEKIGWLLGGAGLGVLVLWTLRGLRGGHEGEASGALTRLVASEDARLSAQRRMGQTTGPLPRLVASEDARLATQRRQER